MDGSNSLESREGVSTPDLLLSLEIAGAKGEAAFTLNSCHSPRVTRVWGVGPVAKEEGELAQYLQRAH